MVRVRNEIRQAEDKLHAEVRAALRAFESEVQSARAREAALAGNLAEATRRSPSRRRSNSVELSALKREVESKRQVYQALADRSKETGLEEPSVAATGCRAQRPHRREGGDAARARSLPNRTRNYQLALLIGLALGIGLTLLFEHFDNTVRTPEDVKAMNLPFLGMIPDVAPAAGTTTAAALGPALSGRAGGRGLSRAAHQPDLLRRWRKAGAR